MANDDRPLRVEVVFGSRPREVHRLDLRLAAGATIADALIATGWPALAAASAGEAACAALGLSVAVWSKPRALSSLLADGDRVEVLRALVVSPMEARRARYAKAGGAKALRRRALRAPASAARRSSARRCPASA